MSILSELPSLRDANAIESMQDQAQLMLHEACANQNKNTQTAKSAAVRSLNLTETPQDNTKHVTDVVEDVAIKTQLRFGKCLLILPLFKEINADIVEQIFFSKVIGGSSRIGHLLCNIYLNKAQL